MNSTRSSGVLLHPTSLPNRLGIGDLGPDAYRFADFLCAAGVKLWQVLPLGPTGYGDSPYQCFSAFAGNPYLVDLGDFATRGLLRADEIAPLQKLDGQRVDYGSLYRLKWPLLRTAYERYRAAGQPAKVQHYDAGQAIFLPGGKARAITAKSGAIHAMRVEVK